MTEKQSILSIDRARFRYAGRGGFGLSIPALSLDPGEAVLLLGQSGSGKSTLLSLICGTITAQEGSVDVAGIDLSQLSTAGRDRHRAENIGVIFQQFNLLPFASVVDNICLPLHFAPKRRAEVADPAAEAKRLCLDLGLTSDVMHRPAGQLSVGQQQRVAAARALVGAPPLVIADEPTSALDADNQMTFLDLLFDQAAAHGAAILMVSHDGRLADRFTRTVQMSDLVEPL